MNKKIGCGGFIIDGKTLQEKDGVLSVIGGGGSSLPDFTNDDKNKGLLLKPTGETTIETKTIIQEQNVAILDYEGVLGEGTFNFSELSDGDTFPITVNGEIYSAEFQDDPKTGGLYIFIDSLLSLYNSDINPNTIIVAMNDMEEGTITISSVVQAEVDVVAPDWASTLPDVTVDDNGKTLEVVGGKWGLTTGKVKSYSMDIVSSEIGTTYTLHANYMELDEAIRNGCMAIGQEINRNYCTIFPVMGIGMTQDWQSGNYSYNAYILKTDLNTVSLATFVALDEVSDFVCIIANG